MSELRKRRRALEDRAESTVVGSSDAWLKQFLIQQFLIAHANEQLLPEYNRTRNRPTVSYSEVEEMWDAGLIERVEALDGSLLMFAEGWDLQQARSALRVKRAL